jgi:uncharacterized protein involved in exopolysaccharide biosynthesis
MDRDSGQELRQSDRMRTVNVLDALVIIAKYKKMILRVVGGLVVVVGLLLFLVVPRWYKSTAVVMPPKQTQGLGLLSSLSRATAPLRSLGLGPASEELSDFQTILASRRLLETVVNEFDLKEVYGQAMMEKAVKELESNVTVDLGTEDVSLEIAVLDTEPERAARMANFIVQTLDKIYRELSVAEARSNREFLETRYLQNLEDLAMAEEALKGFQVKYGVYSVPDQIKAAVEAAATLESRIALEEVNLGILRMSTTKENPTRRASELRLRELRKQLHGLKYGASDEESQSLVFPPFEKAPQMGIEFIRRFREVELQGKLLELLLPLYEQAKVEEQRNTPSVLVLDTAVPAERHVKPKRSLILLLVAVVGFIIMFMVAVFRESMQKAKLERSDADRKKIDLVRTELKLRNLFR